MWVMPRVRLPLSRGPWSCPVVSKSEPTSMSSTMMGCIPSPPVSQRTPSLPYTGSCQVFGSSNEKIHKTISVSILMGQALINIPEVSRMLHKQPLILPGVTCFQILGLPL